MRRILLLTGLFALQSTVAQAIELELREHDGYRWIEAHGELTSGAARTFFNRYHDAEDVGVVVLNMPGGSLVEGLRMGRLFREWGLKTYVPAGAVCLSACFFAYVGGRERDVDEAGALGVHQFWGVSAKETASEAQAIAQTVVADLLQYVNEMGVTSTTIYLGLRTPANEMHVFSREELRSFRLIGSSQIIIEGSGRSPDCPFPAGFEYRDDMGLYPNCQ